MTGATRIGSLLVLSLVVLTAGACGRAAPERPVRAITHLAANRYQSPGDPSMAGVPTAMVGGERRPVLANPRRIALYDEVLPPGRERVDVRVPIPDALRGTSFQLFTRAGAGTTVTEQKPAFASPRSGEQRMRVRVTRRDGQPAYLLVEGRPAPETRYETQPVDVPPDARLRFGIAVEPSEAARASRRVEFHLRVIDGEREHVLFRTTVTGSEASGRWSDHEVSLGRYAGRRVRLRFESSSGAGDGGPARVYPLWGDPTLVAPEPSRRRFRNAILISLDTLRPDHLGCYGYHRPTSPTIDAELAGQGTLFERAYSHFPGTAGSHMTLMTSLYPCVHGLFGGGPISAQRPRADALLLSELLRDAGYRTAAFTEDGYVTAASGFARGFGTFVESTNEALFLYTGQADATLRNALGWLRTQGNVPWFVFIHTYQVHYPYTPPPGYLDQVLKDDVATGDLSVARYDGEIRYTDDLLHEFLAGLAAIPGGADALIVVLADHGEQFGEHGLFLHGNSLYDALLHVPLLLRAPGLVPAGRRVRDPVGLIDVAPTVLALLGLPPPRWTQGRSLVPLLEDGGSLPESKLYAQLPLTELVAVRTGNLKWIINERTGTSRVFDFLHDPGETRQLAGDFASAQLLQEYKAACMVSAPAPSPATTEAIDPAVQEKLRALGYVD